MKTDVRVTCRDERRIELWIWRLLIFVVFAGAALVAEQCAEIWLLPSLTAEHALQQMQPDARAAESLRLWEWARGLIPVVTGMTVLIAALVIFVPGIGGRLRKLADTHI